MVTIHISQGSDEWHAERLKRVTGSQLSSILGINPWTSEHDLWLEKKGRGKPWVDNPAAAHGRRIEPELRRQYEERMGESYAPTVELIDEWGLSSTDGVNKDRTRVLEIKTCGKEVFAKAQNGVIPDYYVSQGAFSLAAIPTAKEVEFMFSWKGEVCYVTLHRDDLYIEKITAIAKDWYDRHLIGDEEPALSERDYLPMDDDLQWACTASEAHIVYAEYKKVEREWKAIKERLLDCTDGGSARGCGITIRQSTRQGSLDVERLESDGVDVKKYRKPDSTVLTVKVDPKYSEGEK
jgi:putative phage-type endonuclease